MTITVYHIPICPFCQRLEILASLKGLDDELAFEVVDITKPRSKHILELTGGSTSLPVMELDDGRSLKESLVLMEYIESRFPTPSVHRIDPYERAIENLMVTMEGTFTGAGYRLVMNPERARRDDLVDAYLDINARLNEFLERYGSIHGPWLFDRFGWAEAVFTPMFQRFWFVEYYEEVYLPDEPQYERVRAWRDACLEHPAAQQTCREEVVKLYYDYARNAGNGALPEGREKSTFAFEPHWSARPWPPRDKYAEGASDEELGLV